MKIFTTKAIMLIIALIASFQFSAKAQNAFAYDISASATSDPSVCQVKYSLNAAASAVVIEVYNNNDKNTKLFEVAGTTTAGANTVNVSFMNKNVPLGTYWFKIKVTSKNLTTPTLNSKQVRFWSPFGIAIDNNPVSKNFGRILVTESNTSLPNTSTVYHSSKANGGIGVGLYAFDPQLNGIKNSKGTYGFTGGLTMATSSNLYPTKRQDGGYTPVFDFKNVKYSEDYSRLFISRACMNGPGIYEFNPDNLEAGATSIFPGSVNTATGEITNGSSTISGVTVGLDVYGSGSNLKIAMLSIKNGFDVNFVGQYVSAYVFNLGTATKWSTAPSATLPIDTYGSYDARWLSNEYSGILFDKDGKGVFVHQGRDVPGSMSGSTGSNTSQMKDYSYIHTNLTNNTADYADLSKRKVVVMEWNHDKTLLAIQEYDDSDFNSDGSPKSVGRIKIYRVTYNNNGAHLSWGSPIYNIVTNAGKNINALEWDYANNLYFCSNGGEYISSVAIPINDATTTPARSEVTFDLEAIAASNVQAVGVKTDASTSAKSIDVTWEAPVHGTVSKYEVQYKTSSQSSWTSLSTSVTSTNYTMSLPADAQWNETYTFNIIPTFTTGEVGASAQSNTVTDYEPSTPISISTAQQQDSEGRYSFNMEVNATINSTNIAKTSCYGANALDLAKYYTVVIPQALADIATSTTDANGNNLTIQYGSILTADEGVIKTLENCYYVQVEANASDKSMPTIVFHNVDPQATYDINVYLNNAISETDINSAGWTYLKYTKATTTSNVMTIPGTTYSFGNASIVTLDENPIATTNEDMPMGSFRKVDSDEPTNPVSYNKANYITTSGSVIQALNVTNEVLENWTITYDITLAHGESTNNYTGIAASNSQLTADFAYLPISYNVVQGEDKREYNRPVATTTLNAKIDVNYTRNGATNTIVDATSGNVLTLLSADLVPAIEISNSNGILTKRTGTHHDSNSNNYWATYYDGAIRIDWDNTPNTYHLIGYYANAIQDGKLLHCWGHYEKDANGNFGNKWIEYVPGAIIDQNNELIKNGHILGIGYDGTNNWAELAAESKSIPLYVHYVYATNDNDIGENNAIINVQLSADYPILIKEKPELIISGVAAINNTLPSMKVISSVPSSSATITLSKSNVVTGIEGITIDSSQNNVKYYNLQGVEVDNPSNGVYIKIEGSKATKVIIK